MAIEYSFPRYLLSKQSVDDRALNKDVFNALKASLPESPIRIIEVGAGIGTMIRRLTRWDMLRETDYVLVDEMAGNIDFASAWIPQWAGEAGLSVERSAPNQIRVFDEVRDVQIHLECADVFDFIQKNKTPADLLIAHAFLDLLPMPGSLSKLLTLTNSLAWLTLNFDGVTTLEPLIDEKLDALIESHYHSTMDTRPTGGSSHSGRLMFSHLKQEGAEIVAAGSSDWVVHPRNGGYPPDEEYFLHFILHFFEQSVWTCTELTEEKLEAWLQARRRQIERGELTYIAHQLDFLVRK
ncbi:MAG: hypothetical protein HS100_22695 [Anaerolineales bacterium]|nr:hypothetical protein [Anaerolineales bacterium]